MCPRGEPAQEVGPRGAIVSSKSSQSGDRVRAVRGEDAGCLFEETHPGAGHFRAQLRGVAVETDDVDFGADGLGERGRQGQLVVEREVGIDRDDSDVEVAPLARSPRGPRAEEHGQAQTRACGERRAKTVAHGVEEDQREEYAPARSSPRRAGSGGATVHAVAR